MTDLAPVPDPGLQMPGVQAPQAPAAPMEPADLLKSLPPSTPVLPPTSFPGWGDHTARTPRSAYAILKQQQDLTVPPKPDVPVSPEQVVQDGARAAVVQRASEGNPDGEHGARFDLARFDDAVKSGTVNLGDLAKAWSKYKSDPQSLDDTEAEQLVSHLSDFASATDSVQNPAKLAAIDFAPDGPQVRVDVRPDEPLGGELVQAIKSATGNRVPVGAPPKTGFGVYTASDGSVTVKANIRPPIARVLRHQFPAVVSKDGVPQWLHGRPRSVSNIVSKLDAIDEGSEGHITEVYDNSVLEDVGGHPAHVAGDWIMIDWPDDKDLKDLERLGTAVDLGGARRLRQEKASDLEEDQTYDPTRRMSERTRKVLIQPDSSTSLQNLADQAEIMGGDNVAIYTHQEHVPGRKPVREHLYTDGVRTLAVTTASPEIESSHGFTKFIKSPNGLPNRNLANVSQQTVTSIEPQPEGRYGINGAVCVVMPKGVEHDLKPDILKSTIDGKRPGFLVVDLESYAEPYIGLGRTEEEATAGVTRPTVIIRKAGGQGQIVTSSDGLEMPVRALDALRQVGIDTSHIVIKAGETQVRPLF